MKVIGFRLYGLVYEKKLGKQQWLFSVVCVSFSRSVTHPFYCRCYLYVLLIVYWQCAPLMVPVSHKCYRHITFTELIATSYKYNIILHMLLNWNFTMVVCLFFLFLFLQPTHCKCTIWGSRFLEYDFVWKQHHFFIWKLEAGPEII